MTDTLLNDCLAFASSIAKRYFKCYKVLFTVFSISCEDLMQEAQVEALKEYRKWEANPVHNLKAHLSMAVGWKKMNQLRTRLLKKVYSTGIIKGRNIDNVLKALRKFTPEDIQCLEIKNNYSEPDDEVIEQGDDCDDDTDYDDIPDELPSQGEVIISNNQTLYYETQRKKSRKKESQDRAVENDLYEYYERFILKKFKTKSWAKIFRMRALENKTLDEIKDKLGLTRQGVEENWTVILEAILKHHSNMTDVNREKLELLFKDITKFNNDIVIED